MPKRAADSVNSIRIELQETERAALEASLTAGGIANLLHGIGAVLLPFQGAITAYVTAWLAGEIAEEAKEALDKIVRRNRESMSSSANEQYQAITAWLYPRTIPLNLKEAREFKKGPDGKKTTLPSKFMRRRFQAFLNQTQQTMFISHMESQNLTLAEAWALFYPWEEAQNEAIYEINQRISGANWFLDLITPDPE